MKIGRSSKVSTLIALAAAASLLTGCAANESAPTSGGEVESGGGDVTSSISGTFAGAGASSQEAAQAAWVALFQTANQDSTINYNPVGSGGGRKQFLEGAVSYAGSDSAMSEKDLSEAGVSTSAKCAADSPILNLPVYVSPIAVVFNLEGIDTLNLDAQTLARIFKGEITSWDDESISALNPDLTLPSLSITVVYRSDDSGTTKNFADYLGKNVPEVWDQEAADKFPFTFAGAEGVQGSSGVHDAVQSGTGMIGYVDASKATDLTKASIKVGDSFVGPTAQGAATVVDASPRPEGAAEHDLAIQLDRTTTAEGAYPIVLLSYLIVCQTYSDAADAQFVQSFANLIISDEGQQAAAEGAGSAPVSTTLQAELQAAADSIK